MRRLLIAVFGLMLAFGSLAFGDSTSFSLSIDEGGGTGLPAGYVTVTVNMSGAGDTDSSSTDDIATITFAVDSAGVTAGYYMGGIFLNVNGNFSVSAASGGAAICGSAPCFNASGPASAPDTFGQMSEELQPNPHHGFQTVSFNLTSANVGQWTNASLVLTPTCPSNDSKPSCVGGYGLTAPPDGSGGYNAGEYAQGFDAAATVGTSSSSASSDNKGVAGFESAAVPEPTSVVLFGSLLLAVIVTFRKNLSQS